MDQWSVQGAHDLRRPLTESLFMRRARLLRDVAGEFTDASPPCAQERPDQEVEAERQSGRLRSRSGTALADMNPLSFLAMISRCKAQLSISTNLFLSLSVESSLSRWKEDGHDDQQGSGEGPKGAIDLKLPRR